MTRNAQTARQIHLHRGCYPMFYDQPRPESQEGWQRDVDNRLKFAMSNGLKLGIMRKGDVVVAVQGWKAGSSHSNTLRIIRAPQNDGDLALQVLEG